MRILQSFDPSAGTSGKITTQTVNPCSVVVLFNHSLYGMTLTLPGGNTANLPPWYFRYYYLPIPGNIDWKQNFALTSTGPPSSVVTGEVYEPSEAEGRTFTEGPLPLQTNVGNTVSTSAGSSNSIQNDANPASTVFIEATQTGGPASNVSATVDGSIQFNQWDGATKKLLLQTIANAAVNNPSVKALAAGMFMEVLGSLQVDQNIISLNNQPHQWKDTGGTARKVLTVDGSNNTQLYGITTLDIIQFLTAAGSVKCAWDLTNGLINIAGTKQTITGNTTGTMDVYEIFSGALKLVVIVQTNYRDTGAFTAVTLKTAFATVAAILNFGCGGILTGTAGVGDADNRQVTWGTGTTAGTQAACTGIASDAAGFTTHGFTQVGNNNYASAHGGVTFLIGI